MTEKPKHGETPAKVPQAGGGAHERTVRRRLSELRREALAYEEGKASWLKTMADLFRGRRS